MKIKTLIKKSLATALAVILLAGAAPISGILSLDLFTKAEAASTEGIYTYEIEDGSAVIYKCDVSASGDIIVPETLGGYTVTAIAVSAFVNCKGIKNITIPENVRSIGISAFEGCSSLEKINIPASVNKIGHSVFAVCSSLEKITVSADNKYFVSDENGILFNKDKTKLISYPAGNKKTEYVIPMCVEEIERAAFRGQKYLEEIIWKNGNVKLGVSAFSGCENLVRVDVPEGVTVLMDWAFNSCSSLKDVKLPESLETIGCGVFNFCVSLESIELPSNLKFINDNAFKECVSLKSVDIPNGVTEIFPRAFEKCYSLESVKIPDSVEDIGTNAFNQCYSLKEINIPGIFYLRSGLVGDCVSLESLTVPEGAKEILADSFNDCRNLKTLHLPQTLSGATGEAFVNCISLTSITVDENNASFVADDGVLFTNDKKTLVYYPAAKSGKVYTVPDSVTEIGRFAFTNAQNLTTVIIPSGVTAIENDAFNGYNIRNIYFEGTQDEWKAFAGVANVKAKLHFNHDGTGHIHEYSKEITAEATCSGNGYETFTCSCNERVEISYHNGIGNMICRKAEYKWIDSETFGCEKTGKKVFTCTECGMVRATVSTAKQPHDIDIKVSGANISYDCKNCSCSYFETVPEGKKYIHYNYGTEEKLHIYDVGEKIALPRDPEKANLIFLGWIDANGEIQSLATMPDANLNLIPKFGRIVKAENADVTITYDEDCFNENVNLRVEELSGASELGGIYFTDGKSNKQIGFFNIKMVNDKNEVCQPNGGKHVTLKIKIPEQYKNRKDFTVYHWLTNGGREKFKTSENQAWIENGYILFNVKSFSPFALYAETATELVKTPTKKSYAYKENLDLSGIELSVIKADGTPETVTDTSKMQVSGYDSSKIGEQTVTVTYEGDSVEFKVNVQYSWWQWIIRILFLGFIWY